MRFDTVSLDQLATFEMGQSPDSNYVVESDEGAPFLQGCAEFGAITPNSVVSCIRPKKTCKPGDILISVRAPVGDLNKADREYCIGRGLAAVRFNSCIENNFGWYLLSFWATGLRVVSQGSTFEAIGKQELANLQVADIPLSEQHCIAEILDTIDAAIQKTEALISKLKDMKQGLLYDLLTSGLDGNGKLRDPKAHPEQFKDSTLGRIPKAWNIRPLEKIAEVDRGKFTHRPRNDPRFYGGAYPFVQTGDIAEADGGIIKSYSQTLNNRGSAVSREFPEDTIAITIAANIADTAILGQPMYFPDSIVGAIVRPPNNVRYIELCIRRAKRILNAHAPQSAQKNINLEDLRPLPIPTPAPEEQNRIGDMYNAYSNRIQSEEKYRDKLKLQKKGLMHDLLTGKVRVRV